MKSRYVEPLASGEKPFLTDVQEFMRKRRREYCNYQIPAKHHRYIIQRRGIERLNAAHVYFPSLSNIPPHPTVPEIPGPRVPDFPWRGYLKEDRYVPDDKGRKESLPDSESEALCTWQVYFKPGQSADDVKHKLQSLYREAYEARRIAWIWLPKGLNCSLNAFHVQNLEEGSKCAFKLHEGSDVIELCGMQ